MFNNEQISKEIKSMLSLEIDTKLEKVCGFLHVLLIASEAQPADVDLCLCNVLIDDIYCALIEAQLNLKEGIQKIRDEINAADGDRELLSAFHKLNVIERARIASQIFKKTGETVTEQ